MTDQQVLAIIAAILTAGGRSWEDAVETAWALLDEFRGNK